MKITQEKFDKLSQLDRIEYRQKEDRINSKYSTGFLIYIINFILCLVAFIFLAYIGLLNISNETL